MYKLRPVTPDDWEFWRSLHHVAERDTIVRQFGPWDEALQDEFAREAFDDTGGERFVVDGVDAGWWHLKTQGGDFYLHQLILPDFQKRGIGRALLTALIDRAKTEGRGLMLQTLLQNTARQLYEKMGFVVTGQGVTHWLMRWQG